MAKFSDIWTVRSQGVRIMACTVALSIFSGAALLAHEFWLVPDAFQVTAGGIMRVRGQNGMKFPVSESAVAVERIVDARLISADGEAKLTDLSKLGTSLVIRGTPRRVGQHIVAVRLAAQTVRVTTANFRITLETEGAPEVVAQYEREGRFSKSDSLTRRSAKYAKTMVEVGQRGARAFSLTTGYPLEFVPLSDPAVLAAGDTLAIRLLYAGRGLPSVHVRAGVAADSLSGAPAPEDRVLKTNADGIVRVPLERAGLWNVRTIHVVPADMGPGADWDMHFTTLVFRVGVVDGARSSPGASGAMAPVSLTASGRRLVQGPPVSR